MLSTSEFEAAIDARIETKSLLKHPFYQAWNAGSLPMTALREYAAQYYHFETAFPTFLSALHSRCSSLDIRQQILANLWDEEHGEGNHTALWLRFCEALGLDTAQVITGKPAAATQRLIETYRALCGSGHYTRGLAALLAYEAQVPAVAVQKVAGLNRFYSITDPQALSFFTTHVEVDNGHAAVERSLVLREATTESDQQTVLAAVDQALDGFWDFLDGAYAHRSLSA